MLIHLPLSALGCPVGNGSIVLPIFLLKIPPSEQSIRLLELSTVRCLEPRWGAELLLVPIFVNDVHGLLVRFWVSSSCHSW